MNLQSKDYREGLATAIVYPRNWPIDDSNDRVAPEEDDRHPEFLRSPNQAQNTSKMIAWAGAIALEKRPNPSI